MKVLHGFLLALVTATTLFCQTPTTQPEFDVASVKVSAPITEGQYNVGVHIDGAMVRCNYLSLRNYLTMAYDVKDYQIVGPDWMTTEHYDIVGKLPASGAPEQQLRGMVASLLADRFKLVFHRETRDLPVYALIVGKNGLKIKEAPPDPATDGADDGKVDVNVTGGGRGGTTVNLGKGSYITYGLNKLDAKKVNFASLMDSLGKFVDRPVVDMTELKGRYDFTLEYSVEELRTMVRAQGADASRIPDMGGDPTISIFSSLEALGLKLDARKAPVEVIVIDHAEKIPTAN
jgi:uncharacterized protein (TIGR03435 family)